MKKLFLLTLLWPNVQAMAQSTDQEALVRKLVRFHIVASQVEYCKSELLKLGSTQENPVFLDPKEPQESRKRFSSASLYPTEKIAYEEFKSYCGPAQETYSKLAIELGIKP